MRDRLTFSKSTRGIYPKQSTRRSRSANAKYKSRNSALTNFPSRLRQTGCKKTHDELAKLQQSARFGKLFPCDSQGGFVQSG
jgi:hypothetical protein